MRIIQDDKWALAQAAVDLIAERVAERPNAVLGLATGSSPLPIYAELAHRVRSGELDLSATRFFALDEYVGLAHDHALSYRAFLDLHVVGPCALDAGQLRMLDGRAEDPAAECEAYEDAIRAVGGIDLQLMGIGHNGHIAFNEPASTFDSRTRVVALSPRTVSANARFFDTVDHVPPRALTQGIGTILEARQLVLIATGDAKAAAVRAAVEGELTEDVPASALRLHPNATFLVDAPAGSLLTRADILSREPQSVAN